MGTMANFESPWVRPRLNFYRSLGLLFRSILCTSVQNVKFLALPIPEIMGVLKKFGQSLDMPTPPFLTSFSWVLVQMDPVTLSAKQRLHFWVRVANPQSWKSKGRRGLLVLFERAFVTSYRLSIVTFPLSLRISQILPHLWFSTPLFPTPPLVCRKCSHVPLGLGGWPLGYEERGFWAKCPCS